jgi:hypothetical protein
VNESRFVRALAVATHKVRARAGSPGDLLGRMWTLFGPPDSVDDDGFSYGVQDRETGIAFVVYSGTSGPAYGAGADDQGLASVMDAFDVLLDATRPADCQLELATEFGRVVIGVARGTPFEETVRASRPVGLRALAMAEAALARDDIEANFYYDAMLRLTAALDDVPVEKRPPRGRALVQALWTRAMAAGTATLERELAHGHEANLTTIVSVLDVLWPALELTAADAGVDIAHELASRRALVARARRRLKAGSPPGSKA